eukprot:TRINITY_DN29396_c0_g1_i1.p1 TRINITY_DN29396_c0_g1~~TRINITY_DN29396_c0_g1_i1.p1  ORF type:complete len:341 (+),score=70.56 TRINITY_DN29396_c0_g1_i1:47-1024(+)
MQLSKVLENVPGEENVSITIADPTKQDCPLVEFTTGFLKMTGYTRECILGRNCRLLNKGLDVPNNVRQKMKAAPEFGPETALVCTLFNHRENGEVFPVLVFLGILILEGRRMIHGIQVDLTYCIFDEAKDLAHRTYDFFAAALPHNTLVEFDKLTIDYAFSQFTGPWPERFFIEHSFIDVGVKSRAKTRHRSLPRLISISQLMHDSDAEEAPENIWFRTLAEAKDYAMFRMPEKKDGEGRTRKEQEGEERQGRKEGRKKHKDPCLTQKEDDDKMLEAARREAFITSQRTRSILSVFHSNMAEKEKAQARKHFQDKLRGKLAARRH